MGVEFHTFRLRAFSSSTCFANPQLYLKAHLQMPPSICCNNSGAVDPAKPIVTVTDSVLDAPTSALDSGANRALLPSFFFTKMPDVEPEDELLQQQEEEAKKKEEERAMPGKAGKGAEAEDGGSDLIPAHRIDQDGAYPTPDMSRQQQEQQGYQQGPLQQKEQAAAQIGKGVALPPVLQVTQVVDSNGQVTYHVQEAAPAPNPYM